MVVARVAGLHNLESSSVYLHFTSLLLAIGLYGSTYGIDLDEAREHRRLIATAVTVGVVCKAALIGVTLWWIFGDPRFLIFGIAVAQIDPLSVTALAGNGRMSSTAKSILASWSAFDDPVTALLTVYGTAVLARFVDLGFTSGGVLHPVAWTTYIVDLGLNLALIVGAFVAWRLVRSRQALQIGLVGVVTAIAVDRFLMLGQSISGLFVRPRIDSLVGKAVGGAFSVAGFMLGLVLAGGVDLLRGISLGVATFLAQVVVALIITRRLPQVDRIHLAFAQQNGVTAIILALLLEAQFEGVVAVVGPAIITVNVIHALVNAAIDRGTARRTR